MSLVHRRYLISYGGPPWIMGYWKKLLDNPPCKKPDAVRNKQFSYELEMVRGPKNILYLHLIGFDDELDEVEEQLAKYKIARIEKGNEMILILDSKFSYHNSVGSFVDFCRDHDFIITGKKFLKKESL